MFGNDRNGTVGNSKLIFCVINIPEAIKSVTVKGIALGSDCFYRDIEIIKFNNRLGEEESTLVAKSPILGSANFPS